GYQPDCALLEILVVLPIVPTHRRSSPQRRCLYATRGSPWVSGLGAFRPQARAQWLTYAATVALYRHRYDITGPTLLGSRASITSVQQAVEHCATITALRRRLANGQRHDTRQSWQLQRIRNERRL